jgi:hypothetical protein
MMLPRFYLCHHKEDVMNIVSARLDQLAHRIDAEGFGDVEHDIHRLAGDANAAGVNAVLLAVLTDDRAPQVARARAFGMVAGAVARGARPTAAPRDAVEAPDHQRPTVHA